MMENGMSKVSLAFTRKDVFSRAKMEELMKKRFFYAPAFGIYGGIGGLYDYGPPGCALQANLVHLWRSHFILEECMLEVDCTALTPHDVLKASGHVDRFTDYMVRDTVSGDVYRADHLLAAFLEKKKQAQDMDAEEHDEIDHVLAQVDNYGEDDLNGLFARFGVRSDLGNALTPVQRFNLMFATSIGPAGNVAGFLRPETAQGQFVNFRKLLECNNDRMPFASAMIGKSFRNEISPRSGLLRVREFLMAEIEHYVHPERKQHVRFPEVASVQLNLLSSKTQEAGSGALQCCMVGDAVASGLVNNETLGYFLARTALFLWKVGVDPERLRFRQHMRNEMAHYASDCWDAEILTSYGWIECVGCADRACYDLTQHTKATGESLTARERLEPPRRVRTVKFALDKRALGLAFKAAAKDIAAVLEALEGPEAELLQTRAVDGKLIVSCGSLVHHVPLEMARLEQVDEVQHVLEYVPAVIEPSFGIGRIIYALLEHSFWTRDGDEQRCVLSLPPVIAPIKCLVAPLSAQPELSVLTQRLVRDLRRRGISCQLDESSTSIGKRYARNDEVGVPFAATLDFQSLRDATATVRERDSTQQIRVSIARVADLIGELVEGHVTWPEAVEHNGGLFVAQHL
jgi:glycyl-tRNA synthetase